MLNSSKNRTGAVKSILIIALFLFVEYGSVFSYSSDSLKVENDSTSLEIKDTTAANLPLFAPSEAHGALGNDFMTISKKDIVFQNYSTLSDILQDRLPFYPFSLGSYGQNNAFSVFGSLPSANSALFNGRPLFDAEFGSYNLNEQSPEFFEKIEILTGSDAAIIAGASGGAALNFQEIRYNSKTPYTRFWFAEGGSGFLGSDGILSQNIARNLNFTFGFRSIVADGEYSNNWLESWNVRALLRWNPSELASISLVENFTNHAVGTNGGVDKENTTNLYDALTATVRYLNTDERSIRHDMTLTASSFLDTLKKSEIQGSVYFSAYDKERRASDFLVAALNDSAQFFKYSAYYAGANARANIQLFDVFKLATGLDFQYINLDSSFYNESFAGSVLSAYARCELPLPIIDGKFSIGGRFTNRQDRVAKAFGGKLTVFDGLRNAYVIDISYADRMPTPVEGLVRQNETTSRALLYFSSNAEQDSSVDRRREGFKAGIGAGIVHLPIVARAKYDNSGAIIGVDCVNDDDFTMFNAFISGEILLMKNVWLKANINGFLRDNSTGTNLSSSGVSLLFKPYYEIAIGRSYARLGLSYECLIERKTPLYVPMTHSYISIDDENGFVSGALSIFASARLGAAFVKLSYNNVLSSGYYFLPYYPEMSGNLRLSVAWNFTD
jgi:hypothetical protein